MKKKIRVAVAMSGGVDSSLAAALLKDQGFDVIGLTMRLWDPTEDGREKFGRCCSPDDTRDARRVAEQLGIPHYVVNFRQAFETEVVEYFIREYLRGRTPNPCIKCNEQMKFRLLLRRAEELECQSLATGHYARIVPRVHDSGRNLLLRGTDRSKDQSYFLFSMTQEQMAKVVFPLGGISKKEVRQEALGRGLRVARKAESQEICFIPDDNYRNFVAKKSGGEIGVKGRIVNRRGKVLGAHDGIHSFTIGQRRGLGLGGPCPHYVVALDPEKNEVIAGTAEDLLSRGLVAAGLNWIAFPVLEKEIEAVVRIRYRHPGVKARIAPMPGGEVRVEFQEPIKSVTPGQAAVFYGEEEVIGGGWIERAL
jgi:tRNA-uridine 2-sulfurtransferase